MNPQLSFWHAQQRDCRRWLVFTGEARQHLCVAMARDQAHALKVARQLFRLPRGAFARLEQV